MKLYGRIPRDASLDGNFNRRDGDRGNRFGLFSGIICGDRRFGYFVDDIHAGCDVAENDVVL